MAVSGQSITRKEDLRFITGKGRYTADVNLPDQCYAIFARSPVAHANIERNLRGQDQVTGPTDRTNLTSQLTTPWNRRQDPLNGSGTWF